jgi:recombination protein RecA
VIDMAVTRRSCRANTREDSVTSANTPDSPKKQALADAVGQIEKQFGKGSIMRLGEGRIVPVSGISTGCTSLDLALGGAGIPRGRIAEIFGPESSGKTTLTLHTIANAQKAGGIAAFIDAEHALDPVYAKKLGVDLEQLLVSQPDTGEQALEIAEMLIRSNGVDLVVIDSVAALVPKAEIEGEMGDSHVGLQARLMSQALRKLTGAISKSNTALIFINQIREKIGVMFGNPETTTGGRALKFYASARIDIRRVGSLKVGEETIGMRARATVVKNKVAPPFRKTEFDILFNEGISYLGDLVDLAATHNILEKSGTWFSFGSLRIGQGRDKAIEFLRGNADVATKIAAQLREKLGADKAAADKAADKAGANRAATDKAAEKPAVAAGAAAANGPAAPGAVASNSRPPPAAASKDGESRKATAPLRK